MILIFQKASLSLSAFQYIHVLSQILICHSSTQYLSGVLSCVTPPRPSPPFRANRAGRYDGRQESARGGRRSSEKHPHVLVHAREEARAQLQHPPDSSRRQPSARGGGGGGEVVSLSFRERLAHNQLARSHPPPSGDGAGTDGGGARYRRGERTMGRGSGAAR